MITINNVQKVFGSLIKKSGESVFCYPCIIYMESCHLGLGVLPQEIANATGCTVRAAKGFSAGKAGWPEWSKSRKDVCGFPNEYTKPPYIAENGYVFVPPEIPEAEEINE